MSNEGWQHFRTVAVILMGAVLLIFGVIRDEPSMMTVGAGLVGFSPAAKGP